MKLAHSYSALTAKSPLQCQQINVESQINTPVQNGLKRSQSEMNLFSLVDMKTSVEALQQVKLPCSSFNMKSYKFYQMELQKYHDELENLQKKLKELEEKKLQYNNDRMSVIYYEQNEAKNKLTEEIYVVKSQISSVVEEIKNWEIKCAKIKAQICVTEIISSFKNGTHEEKLESNNFLLEVNFSSTKKNNNNSNELIATLQKQKKFEEKIFNHLSEVRENYCKELDMNFKNQAIFLEFVLSELDFAIFDVSKKLKEIDMKLLLLENN